MHLISGRIAKIESRLREYVQNNKHYRILHSIPGIGVINASAIVCKYGNASQFDKARSLSVSLELTPKLSVSKHKYQMQGISKLGDPYLCKQLIHGTRALLMICEKRTDDALCRWAARIKQRRGSIIAVVTIANRLAWLGLGITA